MNDSARERFVENLLHYMEMNRISQTDIANRLGVSKTAVSDWVHGRKYPRVDAMQEMADMFGIPMSYLTGDSKPTEEDEDVMELRQRLKDDPNYRILFKTAANVSKEDIMAAVRILKALKGDSDE